jgi:hypothetical protein
MSYHDPLYDMLADALSPNYGGKVVATISIHPLKSREVELAEPTYTVHCQGVQIFEMFIETSSGTTYQRSVRGSFSIAQCIISGYRLTNLLEGTSLEGFWKGGRFSGEVTRGV